MASLLNMSGGSLLNKGLPYDYEVEYLESTGTQYIDTGIIPNGKTGYEVKHSICNNNYTDNVLIGCREDGNDTRFWEDIDWGEIDNIGWGYGKYSYNTEQYRYYMNNNDIGKIVVSGCNFFNNRYCYINTRIFLLPQETFLSVLTKTMFLFCGNYMGRADIFNACKIYYATITDDTNIVMDLIPVCVGTTGYMYDKVSGQLFSNAGTGQFIVGPRINNN